MTSSFRTAQPTFEETFPRAPFAELIRISLALADALVKLRAPVTGYPTARGTDRVAAL